MSNNNCKCAQCGAIKHWALMKNIKGFWFCSNYHYRLYFGLN